MKNKELKEILDNKFEFYFLIGQEIEFEKLSAITIGIMSLFKEAFKTYPNLKEILKEMLNNN